MILILDINPPLVSLKLLIKLDPENGYRISSFVCRVKLFMVGTIFVRQYVADLINDRFHRASLTLAYIVIAVGSFCSANVYVALDVHPHRVLPSVLKLYGEASNHTHASVAAVILSEPPAHSGHVLLLNVYVGPEIS